MVVRRRAPGAPVGALGAPVGALGARVGVLGARVGALGALLLLAAVTVFGQQEADVVEFAEFARPRRMIYFFNASEEEFSDIDRFVLYGSVLMAVGDANPNVIVLESPDTQVPDTIEGRQELARVINADAWVLVDAAGGMGDIRIEVETFDILKQEYFGREVVQPGFPLDYRSLSRGFWDSLAETIATAYDQVVDTVEVRVAGRPGTTIRGLAASDLAIDDSGELRLTLPNPATYTIEALAAGTYPVEHTFYLGYDSQDIQLQQERAALYAVDGYFNNLQFLGSRFWYFIVPATWFVRGGFTSYALGLYLVDGSPSIFDGSPLTTLNAGTGYFLTRPGRDLRVYGGLGLIARILHAPGNFGIEPTAPVGAEGIIGLEYSPWLSLRFFAEYAPLFYYSPDPIEFRLRSFPPYLYPDGNVPGYAFFGSAVLDYRNAQVGLRFSW